MHRRSPGPFRTEIFHERYDVPRSLRTAAVRFAGMAISAAIVAARTAAAGLTRLLSDPSFGMMGMMLYALPIVTSAWVLWLLATPCLYWTARRDGLLLVFVLAWGCFTLVRFEGTNGSISADMHFRWSP